MTGILGSPPAWRASSPTRWYLVFCEVDVRHWWDRLVRTPVGFSHVYALRWDGWNWLLYNPHAAFTHVAIMGTTDKNALGRLVEPGAHVLEVEAFRRVSGIRGRWWTGPMTCVEQIKALLGLPVGRVWTPWQLYRYLLEECGDGQQTRDAGADRAAARGRAPRPAHAQRVDPRGERAAQGDQAPAPRPTDVARLGQ